MKVQSPKVERDFKANLHGIGETLDGVGHVGTERTGLRVKGEDSVSSERGSETRFSFSFFVSAETTILLLQSNSLFRLNWGFCTIDFSTGPTCVILMFMLEMLQCTLIH